MAAIAQLGERQTEDLEVPGSIPGYGKSFAKSDLILRGFDTAAPPVYRVAHDVKRSHGVTVSTLDFESSDGGSNPPGSFLFLPCIRTDQKCPHQDSNLGCRGHNATS